MTVTDVIILSQLIGLVISRRVILKVLAVRDRPVFGSDVVYLVLSVLAKFGYFSDRLDK